MAWGWGVEWFSQQPAFLWPFLACTRSRHCLPDPVYVTTLGGVCNCIRRACIGVLWWYRCVITQYSDASPETYQKLHRFVCIIQSKGRKRRFAWSGQPLASCLLSSLMLLQRCLGHRGTVAHGAIWWGLFSVSKLLT